MSDQQPPADLSSWNDPATAHERFVAENAVINLAYYQGTLGDWLKEKLERERRAAGYTS